MPPFQFIVATAEESGFSGVVLGELNGYYDTLVATGELSGLVMMLACGDKIVHSHVTGYNDWDKKTLLHPDTIFPLYSMSKPLAAIAMMLLHQNGRWHFDDPISKFLPEFENIARLPGSKASRCPTLMEVFTRTSGNNITCVGMTNTQRDQTARRRPPELVTQDLVSRASPQLN